MKIKKFKDCAEFTSGDGCILREFLHPDKEDIDLSYSLAHAVLKSDEISKPHSLKTSEVYYILEGEGRMFIDKESALVYPGDTVYIPPRAVQYIENTGILI